jgi:hypothetical protein
MRPHLALGHSPAAPSEKVASEPFRAKGEGHPLTIDSEDLTQRHRGHREDKGRNATRASGGVHPRRDKPGGSLGGGLSHVEVFAARYGSPLDSSLTLYTAAGQILATNDNHGGSADSLIETTLPRSGAYYVSVIDANDQGGPAYLYRLSVRAK